MGSGLPLPQSSPVRAIASLLHALTLQSQPPSEAPSRDEEQESSVSPVDTTALVGTAMEKLAASSGAFLVNNDRVRSTDRLYLEVPRIAKPQFSKALLDITPMTPVEEQLLEALKEAQENETYQHGVIVGMQSMFVLQNVYCEDVRGQVAAKEAKEDKGKEKRGWLVGDGLPCVLTSDAFVEAVVNYNRAQRDLE